MIKLKGKLESTNITMNFNENYITCVILCLNNIKFSCLIISLCKRFIFMCSQGIVEMSIQ